jgi:signal transduction histidine kinase
MHEYITDLSQVIADTEKQLSSNTDDALPAFRVRFQKLLEDKDVEFIKSDLPSLITDCQDGGSRVKEIIQSLKDFSRMDHNDDQFQQANLNTIITKTLNLLRNEIKYDVDLTVNCDPDLCLEVLPGPLAQVLSNIVINATHAIKSAERRGHIRVEVLSRSNGVVLTIADNGCGIHPDHIKNIFDPFFTTKKAGEGTGLGMNIAYDIVVNRHGGKLRVYSQMGIGTEFSIELPAQPHLLNKKPDGH